MDEKMALSGALTIEHCRNRRLKTIKDRWRLRRMSWCGMAIILEGGLRVPGQPELHRTKEKKKEKNVV